MLRLQAVREKRELPITAEEVVVDCGKLHVCEGEICDCDATGCTVTLSDLGVPGFDMVFTAETADGSMHGHRVRLTRVE